MQIEIYRHQYRVRRAALRGKEVSIPPEVPIKPGDVVIPIYNQFVLFVPRGVKVNEYLLLKSITAAELESNR